MMQTLMLLTYFYILCTYNIKLSDIRSHFLPARVAKPWPSAGLNNERKTRHQSNQLEQDCSDRSKANASSNLQLTRDDLKETLDCMGELWFLIFLQHVTLRNMVQESDMVEVCFKVGADRCRVRRSLSLLSSFTDESSNEH